MLTVSKKIRLGVMGVFPIYKAYIVVDSFHLMNTELWCLPSKNHNKHKFKPKNLHFLA